MWKKLFIGFIAVVFFILGVGLLLPSKMHAERATVIHAAPAAIFAYVNDFQEFNLWSPWAKLDTNTKYTFSGPNSGVGATMAWHSEHRKVGDGQQKIMASEPDRHVQTALTFGDMGMAYASIDLSASGADTRVTWGFDQDVGYNILGRYFGLLMDKFIGADYEQGLASLKALAESAPPAATISPSTPVSTPIAAAPLASSSLGLDLALKSGCLACHQVDRKVVGPAWKDVAARYKNNANAKSQLINKVKVGGKGNWTDVTGGMPMPPYSPRISDADITTLVEFVLAL
jgi:cytochrome c551/c552